MSYLKEKNLLTPEQFLSLYYEVHFCFCFFFRKSLDVQESKQKPIKVVFLVLQKKNPKNTEQRASLPVGLATDKRGYIST